MRKIFLLKYAWRSLRENSARVFPSYCFIVSVPKYHPNILYHCLLWFIKVPKIQLTILYRKYVKNVFHLSLYNYFISKSAIKNV